MKLEFEISEIEQVAQKIVSHLSQKVVLFNGEMGAGKTTLIKEIVKVLGVVENTGSPTYVIVNEYKSNIHHKIYHFDAYRLKSEQEAYDMGFDEYLDSGYYCFVEWPERMQSILPENVNTVSLKKIGDNKREVQLY